MVLGCTDAIYPIVPPTLDGSLYSVTAIAARRCDHLAGLQQKTCPGSVLLVSVHLFDSGRADLSGNFYAHSLQAPDGTPRAESEWEPLADHLCAVAALAKEFAARFGAGEKGGRRADRPPSPFRLTTATYMFQSALECARVTQELPQKKA